MRNNLPRKFISLLLAFFMVLPASGLLTVNGEATETNVITVTQENIAEVLGTYDSDSGKYIQLLTDVEGTLTVNEVVYLDLNGHSIAKVEGTGTLYCMDALTDDFDVNAEEHTGYGKIGTIDPATKVYGVPAGTISTTDKTTYPSGKLDGYLMVTEDDGISFHRVNLQLTHMTLRAKDDNEETCNPSVYYKSAFAGDQLVAQKVESFGVALSKTEMPNEDNMGVTNKYTTFASFKAGSNEDDEKTSTLLYGIMKETNGDMTNESNANRPIYGRAYIKLKDGAGYVFGVGDSRTLKELTEYAALYFNNEDTKPEQKQKLLTMFDTYRSLLTDWDVQNLKDAVNDEVRILGIGNSYTKDSMWLLGKIYEMEQPEKEVTLAIAFYPGCSLSMHANYIKNNSAVYEYNELNAEGTWDATEDMTLKDIIRKGNWNTVVLQQRSVYSGVANTYNSDIYAIQGLVNRTLGYKPTYLWNMTWAYPVEDDPDTTNVTVNTDEEFEEYYDSDKVTMYNAITDAVKTKIVPLVTKGTFGYVIPTGVAIQTASTELNDDQLYRDDLHISNYGRLIAAYTWYCELNGIDHLDELKLAEVPANIAVGKKKLVLSDEQIEVALKAINAALDYEFETQDESTQ